MKWTRTIGAAFAAAAFALVVGIRLIMIHRVPDGALSLGFAVALGTSAIMLLLVARRTRRAMANQ